MKKMTIIILSCTRPMTLRANSIDYKLTCTFAFVAVLKRFERAAIFDYAQLQNTDYDYKYTRIEPMNMLNIT